MEKNLIIWHQKSFIKTIISNIFIVVLIPLHLIVKSKLKIALSKKELFNIHDTINECLYRYNYEKLLLNEAIDIPVDFILNLTQIIKKECDIFKYECVDECGNVKKMRQPIISFHDIDKGWIEIDNNYE